MLFSSAWENALDELYGLRRRRVFCRSIKRRSIERAAAPSMIRTAATESESTAPARAEVIFLRR